MMLYLFDNGTYLLKVNYSYFSSILEIFTNICSILNILMNRLCLEYEASFKKNYDKFSFVSTILRLRRLCHVACFVYFIIWLLAITVYLQLFDCGKY